MSHSVALLFYASLRTTFPSSTRLCLPAQNQIIRPSVFVGWGWHRQARRRPRTSCDNPAYPSADQHAMHVTVAARCELR
jgi:hypothetical protein